MPDYQKGKIYTIRCYDDDSLIYVGSTTQPLAVRWGDHKKHSRYQENPATTIVKLMKDKGEERFYIELYEDFPCERKEQLIKREGEVQRLIATVNKRIEGRTAKEYYQDHKQRLAENHKIYCQDNQAKIKKYLQEYRENNRDEIAAKRAAKITCDRCGSIIRRDRLIDHKKTKKCEELSKNNICPIINNE